MIQMIEKMKKWLGREEGQGMVEYGLILALVAVVAIGGLVYMRDYIYVPGTDNVCNSATGVVTSSSSGPVGVLNKIGCSLQKS